MLERSDFDRRRTVRDEECDVGHANCHLREGDELRVRFDNNKSEALFIFAHPKRKCRSLRVFRQVRRRPVADCVVDDALVDAESLSVTTECVRQLLRERVHIERVCDGNERDDGAFVSGER